MLQYVTRGLWERPFVVVYCIRLTDGGANLEADLQLLRMVPRYSTHTVSLVSL